MRIVVFIFSLCLATLMNGMATSPLTDTDPPIVSASPENLELPCGVPFENSFNDWLQKFGGFEVTDEGDVTYFNTFNGLEITEEVENSSDTLCGNSASIPIGFFAIDDCGNFSDTVFADFKLIDLAKPDFSSFAQNVSFDCSSSVQDTLQSWLDLHGNAIATDLCTDELIWSHYVWDDTAGNNGISEFGIPTNIQVDRSSCSWSVNVSFFVLDECDNANITTANFSIEDNIAPVPAFENLEITVSCIDELNNLSTVFIDGCDDTTSVEITVESNQLEDPSQCEFYNFQMTRTLTSQDACGNSNTIVQEIIVEDNQGPEISGMEQLSLACDADTSDITLFGIEFFDCSQVIFSYKDAGSESGSCSDEIVRTWTATDVCGNASNFTQTIELIDLEAPTIDHNDSDLIVECDQIANSRLRLFDLVIDLLNSKVEDVCSETKTLVYNKDLKDNQIVSIEFFPEFNCESVQNNFLYDTEITTQALDLCGNDTIVSNEFKIIDDVAPEFDPCNETATILLAEGTCDTTVLFQTPMVRDDCSFEKLEFIHFDLYDLSGLNEEGSISLSFEYDINLSQERFTFAEANIGFVLQNVRSEKPFNYSINDGLGNTIVAAETNGSCEILILEAGIEQSIVEEYLNNEEFRFTLQIDNLDPNSCDGIPAIGVQYIQNLTGNLNPTVSLSINGGTEIPLDLEVEIPLEAGIHSVDYITRDCAGNQSICNQTLEIIDTNIPQLVCPSDLTLSLEEGNCELDTILDPEIIVQGTCGANPDFQFTLPQGESTLQFNENDEGQLILENINFDFEELSFVEQIISPVLVIELLADTESENAIFEILDEEGTSIGNTSRSNTSCTAPISQTIDLDPNQLIDWNEDGIISFQFVPLDDAQEGILPCTGGINSYLNVTLGWTEVTPSIQVREDATGILVPIDEAGAVTLALGTYEVLISVDNADGSISECNYAVEVIDEILPDIDCKDITVTIPIVTTASSLIPEASEFIESVSDNCSESIDFIVEGPDITCEDIGKPLEFTIFADDGNDNISFCRSELQLVLEAINPNFSSSLCGGDTLFLFSNVDFDPAKQMLDFAWTGPNGFSSNESDPVIPNAGPDNSGDYNISVTNSLGCLFEGDLAVFIEGLDSPEIGASEELLCQGESLILNSNSFSDDVTYLWYEGISPVGILIGETAGPSLEVNPTLGEHFYYVIVKGPNCQSNPSNTFPVEVISIPEASIKNAFISVCEGESISFAAANFDPTFEYIWTGPNGYMAEGASPDAIENVSQNNAGTYDLTVIDRGCISAPASLELQVFSTPITPIISGENIYCEGVNINMSIANVNTADNYFWYLNGQLFSTTETNGISIPSAQEDFSGEWTVVIEEGDCLSEFSNPFLIEVETSLMVGVTNDGPACMGGEVTLSATFIPDANYLWTSPNNITYEGRIVTVPAVDGIYTLSINTSTGCSDEAMTTVVVLPIPEVTALSNTSSQCMNVGETVTFSSSVFPPGNYEYNWIGPNGFNSNVPSPTITLMGIQSLGTYTLEISNGDCVSIPVSTVVNPTIVPEAPIIIGSSVYCVASTIVITADIEDPVDIYHWITPLGQFNTSSPVLEIPNSNQSNSGDYSLFLEINGCVSETSNILSITVQDDIPTPIITGTSEICPGEEIELSLIPSLGNATYNWTLPNGSTSNESTIFIASVSDVDAGEYTVQLSVDNCESEISTAFNLEVLSLPEPPEIENNLIEVCEDFDGNINLNLGLDVPEIDSYNLYDPNMELIGSSDSADFGAIDLSNFGDGDVTLSISSVTKGCESINRTDITIQKIAVPDVFATFNSDQLILCELGQQTITFNRPAEVSEVDAEILGDNIELLESETNSITINVFDLGTAEIILHSSTTLCENYAMDLLSLETLLEIQAEDDTFQFDALSSENLEVLSNDIFSSEITLDIITASPDLNAEVEGTEISISSEESLIGEFFLEYEICYTECPEVCSQASINMLVGDSDDCIAANLLTPNGDGQNDFFEIPCLNVPGVQQTMLKIFNQWGDLVYSNDDYKNDWSATYNGKTLPVGTYYYVLEIGSSPATNGFLIVEL